MIDRKAYVSSFTRKNPTWEKLFLSWIDENPNLDVKKLETSFLLFLKHKSLISKNITIAYAKKIPNSLSKLEIFNDDIVKNIRHKQSLNFILSLKTNKHKHLFNELVDQEILTILDNKTSTQTLKNSFFNKISRFKNSDELLKSLIAFKHKSSLWSLSQYKKIIRDNNLNIQQHESPLNTLLIEVKDYYACKTLGSQSWCIVENENDFNFYLKKFNRQFILFDFNLDIESNESMIGFTVDYRGAASSSHLKNDKPTPSDILNLYNFPKLNKNYIEEELYLSEFPLLDVVKHDLVEYCEYYLNHEKRYLNFQSGVSQTIYLDIATMHGFENTFLKLINNFISPTLKYRKRKLIIFNILNTIFFGFIPKPLLNYFKIPNFIVLRHIEEVIAPECFRDCHFKILEILMTLNPHLKFSKEKCKQHYEKSDLHARIFNYFDKLGFFD